MFYLFGYHNWRYSNGLYWAALITAAAPLLCKIIYHINGACSCSLHPTCTHNGHMHTSCIWLPHLSSARRTVRQIIAGFCMYYSPAVSLPSMVCCNCLTYFSPFQATEAEPSLEIISHLSTLQRWWTRRSRKEKRVKRAWFMGALVESYTQMRQIASRRAYFSSWP